jgi:hypothetical protein
MREQEMNFKNLLMRKKNIVVERKYLGIRGLNGYDTRNVLVGSAILLNLTLAPKAESGSVADDLVSQASASCDYRRALHPETPMNFCDAQMKEFIGKSCFVVVHETPVEGRRCNWQGCGSFSLVGEAPLRGANNDFIEYGIPTPNSRNAAALPFGGRVLPQSPFPRHYMTVESAAAVIRNCASTSNPSPLPAEVRNKICGADLAGMNANPYWLCYFGTSP